MFIRALENLRTLDPGFRAEDVLLVKWTPRAGYDRAVLRTFSQSVVALAEALPGVRSRASRSCRHARRRHLAARAVDGKPIEGAIGGECGGPRYFETLGTPVLRGREFADDNDSAPPVVIVNEAFAQRASAWRSTGATADGHWIRASRVQGAQVVGLVKDAVYERLRDAAPDRVCAMRQMGNGAVTVQVCAPGALATVAAAMK